MLPPHKGAEGRIRTDEHPFSGECLSSLCVHPWGDRREDRFGRARTGADCFVRTALSQLSYEPTREEECSPARDGAQKNSLPVKLPPLKSGEGRSRTHKLPVKSRLLCLLVCASWCGQVNGDRSRPRTCTRSGGPPACRVGVLPTELSDHEGSAEPKRIGRAGVEPASHGPQPCASPPMLSPCISQKRRPKTP